MKPAQAIVSWFLISGTMQVRQSQSVAGGAKSVATALVRAARLLRRTLGKTANDLSVLHDQLATMTVRVGC
jgi:hypothetical protein